MYEAEFSITAEDNHISRLYPVRHEFPRNCKIGEPGFYRTGKEKQTIRSKYQHIKGYHAQGSAQSPLRQQGSKSFRRFL
jgi:hypothetical protein